jgi:hypothetical protein
MPAPTVDDLLTYLADSGVTSWSDEEIGRALDAERANQARACLVPEDDEDDWPADLTEALKRRVARNLALRRSPVGLMVSEVGSMRITGRDVEIARLEAPHKRWVVA